MSFSDNCNVSVSFLGNDVIKKETERKNSCICGPAIWGRLQCPLTPKAVDDGWMDLWTLRKLKQCCFQNKIQILYCTDIFTKQSTLRTEVDQILLIKCTFICISRCHNEQRWSKVLIRIIEMVLYHLFYALSLSINTAGCLSKDMSTVSSALKCKQSSSARLTSNSPKG